MATREAKVPDIGNYTKVPVIEVLVKAGDAVGKDQGLVTLESDKATMEVPAPFDGVVKEVKVKVGDEVSEGMVVAVLETSDAAAGAKPPATPIATPIAGDTSPTALAREEGLERSVAQARTPSPPSPAQKTSAPASSDTNESARHGADADSGVPRTPPVPFDASTVMPDKVPYASPVVRLFARELGVDLTQVKGSERKGRISKQDVRNFVKAALAGGGAPRGAAAGAGGAGLNLLPWPRIDFAKFGEIETKPLSKIKKISGANLARNWVMIPHVTQHDDADITELESLRVAINKENEKAGIKLTMLGFLIKAVVAALKKYPDFNASLDASGENLRIEEIFPYRFRRRYAERPRRAGAARCGQERRHRDRDRDRRIGEESPRRQARPGRDVRRLLLDIVARRHRRHGVHADRQRARSRNPRRIQIPDAPATGTATCSSRA